MTSPHSRARNAHEIGPVNTFMTSLITHLGVATSAQPTEKPALLSIRNVAKAFGRNVVLRNI